MNIDKLEEAAIGYLPDVADRKKKHVSVIVCKNTIVSVGTNKMKTHPLAQNYQYRFDEVHSELDAWIRVTNKSKQFKLFNFRFGHNNEWRMARPCKLCMPWCKQIFKEIYYTTCHGLVREV